MKIPYNWVREFVNVRLSPQNAADRLINAGVEVASVTPVAPPGLAGVVVGEIEAVERELGESHGHRLVLCRVRTGRERFAVVCGAPNAKAGARAAFAPPGATLPGDRRVGVATIHGVQSHGMLCSERELGLGDEHEAGLLLVDGARPGADLVKALGLDDHVLDIEITPNRPDCLSVLGIARELAALTGARLTEPRAALREGRGPARDLVRVRIEAPDACRRYTVRVISGVRVGPSPAWLAARLRAVGLRPISNVVDATNYVLWELGHPLHAFDASTVDGATIVVRRATSGERFRTLDGSERVLSRDMLVIADPRRAIGLAGVMGGANTEVSDRTTRVFLESAYFDPATTRRTARALGLKTDAAYRFERGADIEALVSASARTAGLIVELAGGDVARGIVDVYPRKRKSVSVRLRMSRVERVLGVAPPRARARRILTGLGLGVRDAGKDLVVAVPSFRRDLAMEDDLVEEVIRVWGYDKIPTTLVPRPTVAVHQPATLRQAQTVRQALVGAGLHEVVTYGFSDPALDAVLGGEAPVELLNPMTQEASCLRRHPLEGVLGAIAANARRQQADVAVFELCKVYRPDAGRDTGAAEPRWAAVALTGVRPGSGWPGGGAVVDVYDVKGLAEHALDALGLRTRGTRPASMRGLEPDSAGALAVGPVEAAWFGEVAETLRQRFDVKQPVFAAMLALDDLLALPASTPRYEPLPRFPSVERDMAFTLEDPALTAAEIEAAIRAQAGPLLRGLGVFDVFRLPDGRRSVAFRLTFQADDRTLTDDEVNAIRARVAERVCGDRRVTLRGA
jgi:phenylalanyl-tRNA synthetase beta chain